MKTRRDLHVELCDILGTSRVYFNPPETIKLSYPCIIYNRERPKTYDADDQNYHYRTSYSITVIDKNAESVIGMNLFKHFKYISWENEFVNDGLYHYVYNLYY